VPKKLRKIRATLVTFSPAVEKKNSGTLVKMMAIKYFTRSGNRLLRHPLYKCCTSPLCMRILIAHSGGRRMLNKNENYSCLEFTDFTSCSCSLWIGLCT